MTSSICGLRGAWGHFGVFNFITLWHPIATVSLGPFEVEAFKFYIFPQVPTPTKCPAVLSGDRMTPCQGLVLLGRRRGSQVYPNVDVLAMATAVGRWEGFHKTEMFVSKACAHLWDEGNNES